MRRPSTLWPIEEELNESKLNAEGIPLWATITQKSPQLNYSRLSLWPLLGLVLVIPLLMVLSLLAASNLSIFIAILAVVDLIAIGGFYLWHTTRLEEKLAVAERWNETVFERNDIPLWREDWSVARDAVLRLLKSGERDIHSYYSSRPEELRELRSNVFVKDVNKAAMKRAGVSKKEELIISLDLLLPDTDETFLQWLVAFAAGDTIYRSETHITLPDGKTRDTLFSAALPRNMRDFEDILVSDLDITAYKAVQARVAKAEAEVARTMRVSMMGALSASIAHEVNSPLAAILSSSEAALLWLKRESPSIDEAIKAMRSVNKQAYRAKKVIEKTRSYLNNTPATVADHSIDKLVFEALLLIKRELRELKASVQVSLKQELPSILADPVNIQQVLINLIINAAQAMEGKQVPREISITASVEGPMMQITVSDNGDGVDTDRLSMIFAPFYTTKNTGMGMGLAICRTCISAHGGDLWATNNAHGGAQFHFTLPIVQ